MITLGAGLLALFKYVSRAMLYAHPAALAPVPVNHDFAWLAAPLFGLLTALILFLGLVCQYF